MTVFVTQHDHGRDYSDAERFGEIIPLAYRGVYPDDEPKLVAALVSRTREGLRHFDSEKDHLLLSGDPALIAICVRVAAERATGQPLRCLKWDREGKQYYEVKV